MTSQPFVLLDVHWRNLPEGFAYPSKAAYATTGYRGDDGPSGLFSVYVVVQGGSAGPEQVQHVKLYALVDAMSERLPAVGGRFVLSTGATSLAECVAVDRGEDDPEAKLE